MLFSMRINFCFPIIDDNNFSSLPIPIFDYFDPMSSPHPSLRNLVINLNPCNPPINDSPLPSTTVVSPTPSLLHTYETTLPT